MRSQTLFLLLGVLGLSIFTNFFLFNSLQNQNVLGTNLEKTSDYSLLSPKILGHDFKNRLINNFLPLRQELRQMTDPYKDKVALYFEYLPTGTSIGINEDAEFTAASLLKVPVVMAYLHKKERLGLTDDPTVEIQENELNSNFGELYKQGAGSTINLGDAVKLTLQKSDNTASLVLADQIPEEDFNFVYEGLDIDPKTINNSPIINAENYASILRSLFFSSVLTKENSQYILDLLTHTEFDSLLASGIPDGTPFAHKIGLIDHQIYSDCGIVYVPDRPYLLCVISESDRQTAKGRMHDISKTIYEYVVGYKIN